MSKQYRIHCPDGLYFMTWTTIDWISLFIREEYRQILLDNFKYCIDNKGLRLHAYVIMPNHLHLIASAAEGCKLGNIVRDYKKYTSKALVKAVQQHDAESRKDWLLYHFGRAGRYNSNNENFQLWRQNSHSVELHSNEWIMQKLEYIHNNPVIAGLVAEPEDYLPSSARNYAGLPGELELELLD